MNATLNAAPAAQPRLRADLVIHPDAETGHGRVVKDPRSRRYFHFDESESFIIERLDGERTPIDIQIALLTERGEEFSLDDIQEFLDMLAERGLLEDRGPALPVREPALGRQVVGALERGGFRFRRADDPPPPGVPQTRRNMAEAREFDEGVELLHQGRFRAALRVFDGIIAANPRNQRAAALRQVLLQAGAAREQSEEAQPAKRRNSPLYYRVPLLDPDRFFGAVEPWLRGIWSRGFLTFYFGVLGVAGWIALTHRAELLARLPHLTLTGWAGGLIVAAILLTALHECAHGLTCKHFGGKIPELGFLLIFFFMPALYVDVSDAWLFRRRRERALVGLAGPMFDLFSAAMALIVWRVLPPGPLGLAAILVMTSSGGSFLLNINPLMRLDGYYILSDLSGIPNLRKAALGAVGRGLAALTGRKSSISLTARARAFLAVYGVLSAIYISLILFFMLRMVTHFATRLAGLWGPAVIGAVLVLLLRRPLKAAGRLLGGWLRGMSPRRAAALGTAVIAVGALALTPRSLRVSGPAEVRAARQAGVRPEISGNLASIEVRAGEWVEQGQIVARLDRSDLLAQLSMTNSDIARARADLRLLVDGPEEERVRQAREKVRAARTEVAHLRARHQRLENLRSEGLVSADLYEQVSKDLALGEGGLRAATEEARLVEKGARPERIEAARAEVGRLETKAADVLRRLGACDIRAPIAGVVVTEDLASRVGERFPAGGLLFEIADTGALVVDVSMLESEIGDVRVGQPVRLRLAAFPGRAFSGRTVEISPAAAQDELGRAQFRVRCEVEDSEGLLRPGMTGSVKIDCGRRTIARLVARRLLRLIDPSLL